MGKSNQNGKTHRAYLSRYDGRTVEGRMLSQIEAGLAAALGGTPSPQQILILQRASIKAIRCALIEREMLKKGGKVAPSLEKRYLSFARSLREDLRTLGLKRKAAPVPELQTYVKEAYGQ